MFDMILRVYNGSDWKTTLMEVMPQRKGAILLDDTSVTTSTAKVPVEKDEEPVNPITLPTDEPTTLTTPKADTTDQMEA